MPSTTDTAEDLNFGPGSDMSEEQQKAVVLRAKGATYPQIAFELGISEDQARIYAPFQPIADAIAERENMRLTLVMGDRGKLAEMMEKYGVGLHAILNRLNACLHAKRYILDGNGKIVAVDDCTTQMTAVRCLLQAAGIFGDRDKEDADSNKPVEIHLHPKTVEKVERLVGRKIIDVEGESADDESNGRANVGFVPADIGRGRAAARSSHGSPLGTLEVHRRGTRSGRNRSKAATAPDGPAVDQPAGSDHGATRGKASRASNGDTAAATAVDIGAEW